MDMVSIIARVASGYAVKAAVALAVLYAGHAVYAYVVGVFSVAHHAMGAL